MAIPTGALAQTTAPACSRAALRLFTCLVAFRLLSFPTASAMSTVMVAATVITLLARAGTGLAADLTDTGTMAVSRLVNKDMSMQASSMHTSALFRLIHIHVCIYIYIYMDVYDHAMMKPR